LLTDDLQQPFPLPVFDVGISNIFNRCRHPAVFVIKTASFNLSSNNHLLSLETSCIETSYSNANK